ncbi:MAG: HAMP domain-containing histidine kinase [Muribaculaceae bacterium]|nr:HAMP domain-containing histidine kinase [Muribaculaceae bacterium]
MKHITAILLLILPISAMAVVSPSIEDSLYHQLSIATTPEDSIQILTNLYDLLPRKKSIEIGNLAIPVARRAHDTASGLDLIRNQANRYMRSDSMLRALRRTTFEWPESEDRTETLTFIAMMDNMRRGRYGDENERQQLLDDILVRMRDDKEEDDYGHIELLHGICMLLSYNGGNSELLTVYMDTLGSLVRRLPPTSYAIRNAYDVHASSAYSTISPEKSVDSDIRLINNIERLERYYKDKGRNYRNYDTTYYTIYTRLLSNYRSLSPAQVEDFYSRAISYLDKDPAIEKTYNQFPAPDIYYAFYHGDYAKAARLIKNSEIPKPKQLFVTRMLMECADSIGDEHLLREASREYASLIEEELEERSHGSYRELQVAYSLYDMKNHLSEMERERDARYAAIQRWIIIGSCIVLLVLIALLILLLNKSRKNKEMAKKLKQSNDLLKAESENLRLSREESVRARAQAEKASNMKSDFIKNMSYEVKVPLQAITEYSRLIADCAQNSGSKHITRFADMLEVNSELLSTIVNDVLRLSDVESSPLPLHPQPVNLQKLCEASIEAMHNQVHTGVKLILDTESTPDLNIFTDPQRLQQILNNLLTNAAKFTSEGSITVSCKENPTLSTIEISVTDTGIGINPENREKIFERFVKLNHESNGAGLGLTIARIIARRMGGDLRLDSSFRGKGSRFILTLPKKDQNT